VARIGRDVYCGLLLPSTTSAAYATDQYRLLITIGGVDGVGGDFRQTSSQTHPTDSIQTEEP